MGVQALPLGHPPTTRRLQTLRQVSPTQTAPAWQLSGRVRHFWPTALTCWDEQSHTVESMSTALVSPARKTHLNPPMPELQVAAPTGLQLSRGGEGAATVHAAELASLIGLA